MNPLARSRLEEALKQFMTGEGNSFPERETIVAALNAPLNPEPTEAMVSKGIGSVIYSATSPYDVRARNCWEAMIAELTKEDTK